MSEFFSAASNKTSDKKNRVSLVLVCAGKGERAGFAANKLLEKFNGKTVAEKFNVHQDDYLKVDGKYYGVPHYQGEYGFVYDADLFEKKGYYFRSRTNSKRYTSRYL